MAFDLKSIHKTKGKEAKDGTFYILKNTPISVSCRKLENYKTLAEKLKELPPKGEYWHIVSKNVADYYDLLPIIIQLSGSPAIEVYASTWIMNMENAKNLIDLIEKGAVKKIMLQLGEFMPLREPVIYEKIRSEFQRLGQKMNHFGNHAKVLAIKTENNFFVCEGSANFSQNPRMEQFLLTDSENLYNFHKDWMEYEYNK